MQNIYPQHSAEQASDFRRPAMEIGMLSNVSFEK
jgi:hypothetical protein